MNVGLAIAGVICIAMALGHETIGVVWVLPSVSEGDLPRTPFGPRSTTVAMVHVTWHIVTIFVMALGGLLVTLAWGGTVDPQTTLLRWFAAMWLAATAMAAWIARRGLRNPRQLLRLPVPLLWIAVAVLCWKASV